MDGGTKKNSEHEWARAWVRVRAYVLGARGDKVCACMTSQPPPPPTTSRAARIRYIT